MKLKLDEAYPPWCTRRQRVLETKQAELDQIKEIKLRKARAEELERKIKEHKRELEELRQ